MFQSRQADFKIQPCTVRDFLNYLIYIEHSAENLQFSLWLRNYTTHFHAATTADMDLAPEWTQESQDETFDKLQKEHREGLKRDPTNIARIFKGTDFEKRGNAPSQRWDGPLPCSEANPFSTPPRTPQGTERGSNSLGGSESNVTSYHSQASEAFAAAGIKAPCKLR